jgi:DNA polymerase III delta subunit
VLLQASIYMDYSTLINEIRNKDFRPIYFLTGDEPFFIDKIVSLIEHSALEEAERSFNQYRCRNWGGQAIPDDVRSCGGYC